MMSKKEIRNLNAMRRLFKIYLNTHKGKNLDNLNYLCGMLNNMLLSHTYDELEEFHIMLVELCQSYHYDNYIYYDIDENKFCVL